MNVYYPSYYKDFMCLAGKCPDTCCAQWEIIIDPVTDDYYSSLSGEFAKRLRKNIVTDAESDRVFALNNGRCPFLNKDNLCDIIINLGEEHICSVCKMHPRFTEEYDSFTEISLSLSCPRAAEIICSADNHTEIYPDTLTASDDELLTFLQLGRKKAFDIASRPDIPFYNKLSELIYFTDDLQTYIDFNDFTGGEAYISRYESSECYPVNEDICDKNEIFSGFMKILLSECEILTPQWRDILMSVCNKSEKLLLFRETDYSVMNNILSYYIYRYFLKAVNNDDILSYCLFISFSCLCTEHIYLNNTMNIPLIECARLYSKEIEHDTDNIDLILEHNEVSFDNITALISE